MLSFYYQEAEVRLTASSSSDTGDSAVLSDNNYSGLLNGMNVIIIMIESGQEMSVNKYLTPTLYKLEQESLYFSQNYSVNKTNVSEQIGIGGNSPTTNVAYNRFTYILPFTIPNLFKGQYVSSFFHDNNPEFYDRGDE